MRLIDGDELIEHVWRDRLDSRERIANLVESMPTIKTIPAAAVAPVVHGRWLPIVSYNNTYKCSECGRLLVDIADGLKMVAKHYPYCHCGAKMDGERKEWKV